MFHRADIFSSLTLAEHEGFVCSMSKHLSGAGVDILAIQTGYSPGQLKFTTAPKFGIQCADQMFTLKEAVKEISTQHGWQATFMTKPVISESGCISGMHFSGSLWTGDQNAFHDPQTDGLSVIGRHWVAGLIRQGAALTALISPTVNCYRLVHTPDRGHCGLLRTVAASPCTTYVENRLPSSAANPYIVLAATVAAGIDGIVNRLELPDETETLPSSLSEALSALEADTVLCGALGGEFITWFLTVKRQVEIAKVDRAKKEGRDVLQVERQLYFKFL